MVKLNFQSNDLSKSIQRENKIIEKNEDTSLDEIFKCYTGNYKSTEWDFGEDIGFEKIT